MSAVAAAERYSLRCGDRRHLSFGRVVMTCAERAPLDAFLASGYPTCLELADNEEKENDVSA